MNPRVSYVTFEIGDEKSAQIFIPAELSKSGREEIKIVSDRGEAQSLAMRINSHLKKTGRLPEDLLEGFTVHEATEQGARPGATMPVIRIGSDELTNVSIIIDAMRKYQMFLVFRG